MSRRLRFNAEARSEFRDAVEWYRESSPELAPRFAMVINSAIREICERPELWPALPQPPRHRRRVLTRFPYAIIYKVLAAEIVVVAISHQRRSPSYWLSRTR